MADITGTSGDDTLNGTADPDTISGLAGNDELSGSDGNDALLGGDGEDELDGGDGDDTLDGGTDADQLLGSAGDDVLIAYGGDSADGGNGNDALTVRDGLGTVYDGGADTDSLTLDLATAESGVTANLTYLWAGLSASIGSATVSNFESIVGAITGSSFDDAITIGPFYASGVTMHLGSGNDTGIGGSGDDSLNGGLGNDALSGGDGQDTLSDADGIGTLNGDSGDDFVVLGAMTGGSADGGAGFDFLRFDLAAAASGASISLNTSGGVVSGYVGGVGIEGFEGLNSGTNRTTEHNDTVTIGTATNAAILVELLAGNDSYSGGLGNDAVNGGAGDDVLNGGAGTNTLTGGAGNDSLYMASAADTVVENAGEGVDTLFVSFSHGLDGTNPNVENLTLIGTAYSGYGNDAANVLTGSSGYNVLSGGGGDDVINAGDGNDVLYGGTGNDTLNGEAGGDYFDDGFGINAINGGAGDDVVVLSGDAVNNASGGAGDDYLDIRAINRTTGYVIDLTGMWIGGNGTVNGGSVSSFEALVHFDGTQWADVINLGAGTLAGGWINDAGAGNDTLTGTDGANHINGGEGDDMIASGAGADEILGGAGNDTITIGATTTGTADGGIGTDTLRVAVTGAALDVDLTLLWGGGTGTVNGVAVSGIEQVQFDPTPEFGAVESDTIVIGAGYTGSVALYLGQGADAASGGSGNDSIYGGYGDDVLHGGAGSDELGGYHGSDTVYGDAGDDTIQGDTLDVEGGWGNDHLYGGDGNDTIEGGAHGDWLYGEAGNDVLRGDSLPLGEADHGGDFLDGGIGDDQLFGDSGSDYLVGRDGNDVLNGGAGADSLQGDDGNDHFYVDNAGDAVIEGVDGGTDRVFASASYALGAGVSVETLSTTGASGTTALNLAGNELANNVYGNYGNNVLHGGGGNDALAAHDGNDTLNGGTGADSMAGGLGNDNFYVDAAGDTVNEAAGQGTDRILSSVSFTLAAGLSIETLSTDNSAGTTALNLTGNDLANNLYGNNGDNGLFGGGGNDTIIAQDGNDTLNGGAGTDTMNGGLGDDWFYVDAAGDRASEAGGQGTDRVFASNTYALTPGQSIETLSTDDAAGTAAINLVGNELANNVYGNNGDNVLNGGLGNDMLIAQDGNDTLYGGIGSDSMSGGLGNDWFYVDSSTDVVSEAAGQGTDRIFTTSNYVLAAGVSIETLSTDNAAGTAAITLIGNELANNVYGNFGNNSLYGSSGNDSIIAHAGNDLLNGGAGADALTGGAGADTFVFANAAGPGNIDSIGDYVVADDVIHIDNAIFTGLPAGTLAAGAFRTGAAAVDADDRIVYNSATGALFFDADGNGAGAAAQFATLATGLAMTAGEFFVI